MRPLKLFCGISCRGYSKLIQRRVVAFGAEASFGRINEGLKEHYGIELPLSSLRLITLSHAKALKKKEEKELNKKNESPKKSIISQADGCMVPIVTPQPLVKTPLEPGAKKQDRRKGKTLSWKEARLTLAHEKGSVTPKFSATMGEVDEVGRHMMHCAQMVGFGENTEVHSVGDGATWISDQVEVQFGDQATYLIDLYHLCDYLIAAAKKIAPGKEKAWMEKQKDLLKDNRADLVLAELLPFIEEKSIPDAHAPVRACYRYISNRLHQLDYKTALEKGLPIGSGEIESAHRYIIQERLKLPGAWWLDTNAKAMLALRTARANGNWDSYWRSVA